LLLRFSSADSSALPEMDVIAGDSDGCSGLTESAILGIETTSLMRDTSSSVVIV
jgi:hypothetical protein